MKTLAPASIVIASFALVACGGGRDHDADSDAASSCGAPDGARLFVSTSDYNGTGSLAVVGLSPPCVRDQIAPQSSDAVLARDGSRLVVMNSGADQDNITFFDTTADPPLQQCQFSVTLPGETDTSNPRGYLAVDAHRAYVARFNRPSMAIVNTDSCAITGAIDLAPFRGTSPLPYPRPIAMVRGEAWVALERLPNNLLADPSQQGLVVRIDPATDAPIDNDSTAPGVQGIELPLANPVGRFDVRDGRVLIACVGWYQRGDDGGVVEIDASTRATSVVVGDLDVGGNIDSVISLDASRVLVRVSGAAMMRDENSLAVDAIRLVEWNRETRLSRVWLETTGYSLTEPVLASDGRVYVGDRGDVTTGRASSIRIFDPATGNELAPVPGGTELPPYDMIE
jgi:hypothetical protein